MVTIYTFNDCPTDADVVGTDIKIPDLELISADLKFGYVPEGPFTALEGTYADGFEMYLDPTVDYYYLDTDMIETNLTLKDGSYPFYLSPDTTTPVFYLKVEGTNYSLVDGYLFRQDESEQTLRINGDFAPGTYTYSGE